MELKDIKLTEEINATLVSAIPISYLDTDGSLTADSAAKVPSQSAVRDYALALSGGTLTGTVTLAGVQYRIRVEIDTYNVVANDCVIVCNKATAMTVNLQAASGSGRFLVIANIGAGLVTVDGNSSDTIDGSLTQTLNQYDTVQIVDYAANNWKII